MAAAFAVISDQIKAFPQHDYRHIPDETREDYVWALANMCSIGHGEFSNNLCDSKVVLAGNVVPALTRLLVQDDAQAAADACWVLALLSDGSEALVALLVDHSATRRLVDLAKHPNPEVHTPALRAVSSIVAGSAAQADVAFRHGFVAEPRKDAHLQGHA